jgi:lipid A 3-O-deacylase
MLVVKYLRRTNSNLCTFFLSTLSFALLTAPFCAFAEETAVETPKVVKPLGRGVRDGQSFGIAVENDSKNIGGPGSDQAYSNGVHFSYVYARDQVPKWAPKYLRESDLFKSELTGSTANFGLSLNHQIFTPNNIHVAGLEANDRQYAAWLNFAFSVLLKNHVRSQSIDLSLGVIGPAAGGESVQNSFHRLIGTEKAAGWGNQLKTEPAVQLTYQQRLNFVEIKNGHDTYFDLIPMLGGGLGNVFIGLHLGLLARLGYNLPDDIGPSRPSGGDSESFVAPMGTGESRASSYIFAGIRGNVVGRNVFLDGNTFQPSHHVTKYPVTAETEIGLAMQLRPVSITWRFVVRSPDFEENSGFNSFASVGISFATD